MAETNDLSEDTNSEVLNQNDFNNSIAVGRKISIKSNKSTNSLKIDKNIQSKDQIIKFKGKFKFLSFFCSFLSILISIAFINKYYKLFDQIFSILQK